MYSALDEALYKCTALWIKALYKCTALWMRRYINVQRFG